MGPAGATGAEGEKGDAGPYFTPSVSSSGDLSWTNNGNLSNPPVVNIKGPQGEIGPEGPQGPQGEQGEKGDTGSIGPQGKMGPYYTPNVDVDGNLSWTNNGGLENPTTVNIKGPQGDTGDIGPQGPQGIQGETGPYYIPNVDNVGNLSWTNTGNLQNPETVNIRGPQGLQGTNGESPYVAVLSADNFVFPSDSNGNIPPQYLGEIASVEVYYGNTKEDMAIWTIQALFQPQANVRGSVSDTGAITVSTFNPPSDVGYVIITLSKDNISLTKVLRLIKAKQGVQGMQGPAGTNGANGVNGATFTPSVSSTGDLSWTNDKGLDNPATVNIMGPQGPQGDPGQDGAQGIQGPEGPQGPTGPAGVDGKDGTSATIQIGTVTTGAAGTQATVTNTGTANAAVFNFIIPQGVAGQNGADGAPGAQGPQGPAGTNGTNGADATINGVNALTITTSQGITGTQSGSTYNIGIGNSITIGSMVLSYDAATNSLYFQTT